jgi:CheY-like chemotaxis protein
MTETSAPLQIILIDDNDIDQLLHRKLIERSHQHAHIVQFTDASHAIQAIADQSLRTEQFDQNIILLDIKMPVMDGFQFLEAFDLLSDAIKQPFTIFILTSSLNQFDISRSKSNPYVKDMIIKPINGDTLINLLSIQ